VTATRLAALTTPHLADVVVTDEDGMLFLLADRETEPGLTFRNHLRRVGGEIEV
jgi:hypothetical protein